MNSNTYASVTIRIRRPDGSTTRVQEDAELDLGGTDLEMAEAAMKTVTKNALARFEGGES